MVIRQIDRLTCHHRKTAAKYDRCAVRGLETVRALHFDLCSRRYVPRGRQNHSIRPRSHARHASRRRLGPYARTPVTEPKDRQRQLASFARAGFSLAMARQVMDLDSAEDADALAEALRHPAG